MAKNSSSEEIKKVNRENDTSTPETNLERITNELKKFYSNWLQKGKSPQEIVHFLDILAQDLKMEEEEVLKCLKELEKQQLLKVISMGNFSPIKLTSQGWESLTGYQVKVEW